MEYEQYLEFNLSLFRKHLERCWRSWRSENGISNIGIHPAKDMCKLSTVALLEWLKDNDISDEKRLWRMACGSKFDPEFKGMFTSNFDGGMRDNNDEFHGHVWATDGQLIIDLTSDQFGYKDKVAISDIHDSRYRENITPPEMSTPIANFLRPGIKWYSTYSPEPSEIVTLYHGTTRQQAEIIKRNGWQPFQSGFDDHLKLSGSPECASEMNACVLEVHVPKAYLRLYHEKSESHNVQDELDKKGDFTCVKVMSPEFFKDFPMEHKRNRKEEFKIK